MSPLLPVSLALKAGALVDALHRRAPIWWPFVIVLLPAGELLYLALVMAPEWWTRRRGRRPGQAPLEELRCRLRENPCHENQLLLADRLYEHGRTDEARGLYQGLLKQAPDDKGALYGLAQCHLGEGRIEDAVGALDRLVALRRSFADYAAWLQLAEALSACGRHDEALDSLERLVQAAPRLAHQLALALVQQEAGMVRQALGTLEGALENYKHAPRFVRRQAREPARRASRLLGRLQAVA